MRNFGGRMLPHICEWGMKANSRRRKESFTPYLYIPEKQLKPYIQCTGINKVVPVHIIKAYVILVVGLYSFLI